MDSAEDGVVDSAAFYLSETRNNDRATHASNHPSHANALLRPINTNDKMQTMTSYYSSNKKFSSSAGITPDSVMRGVQENENKP